MTKSGLKDLTLDYVRERVDNLPLLPSVSLELNQLSQDADKFYEKVQELAEQDPPLAAKILAFANSLPITSAGHIFHVDQALPRLGVLNTLELMNQLLANKVFEPSRPEHKGVWRHSVETAHICRFLAQHTPGFHVDAEAAYTCGLLHDIGRFILLQVYVNAVEEVDEQGWDSPEELTEVETQMFGFTHAEIGRVAAEHWQLPKTMTNTLRFHHHYNLWELEGLSESFLQLLTVVQFADFLSVLMITHPEWPAWGQAELEDQIRSYCIHRDWPEIDVPIGLLMRQLPHIHEYCEKTLRRAGVA